VKTQSRCSFFFGFRDERKKNTVEQTHREKREKRENLFIRR